MQNVAFCYCNTECHYAECRFAECRGASIQGAVTNSAKFPGQAEVKINIKEFLLGTFTIKLLRVYLTLT